MEKINIRTDLSIGDQKIGAKMNTNGLWSISEVTICGLPIEQGVEAIGKAMLDLNVKVDLANRGREPIKKKVGKKTVESTSEKPGVKRGDLKLKKPKEKNPENKKLEISGGTDLKTTPGESGEKGKNLSG